MEQHIYYERYVGEDSMPINQWIEFDEKYLSNSDTVSFPIISSLVPKEEIEVTLANPSEEVLQDFVKGDSVRFCLHPQFAERTDITCPADLKPFPSLTDMEGIASSSTRTTLCIVDGKMKKYATKHHSPARMMNYYRTIGAKSVKHALRCSNLMEAIERPGFAILPETFGAAFPPRNGNRSWGFKVREMVPRPHLSQYDDYVLIPFFSLYSGNKKDPSAPPLLRKYIDTQAKENHLQYLLKTFMFPLIDHWVYFLLEHGIVLELHGQNTLIETNLNTFETGRIVFRDLDLRIHGPLRRAKGHSMEGLDKDLIYEGATKNRPEGAVLSLKYDRTVGKLFFDFLAKCFEENYGISREIVREECVKHFHSVFPRYQEYLPKVAYDIGTTKYSKNGWHCVEMPVRWRPE